MLRLRLQAGVQPDILDRERRSATLRSARARSCPRPRSAAYMLIASCCTAGEHAFPGPGWRAGSRVRLRRSRRLSVRRWRARFTTRRSFAARRTGGGEPSAGRWSGLKKGRARLRRDPETTRNERLKSRGCELARRTFGRGSEQRSAADGSPRGRRRGTLGQTPRPDLPVRGEESIPGGRDCCDELRTWMEGDERDRRLISGEFGGGGCARLARRKRRPPARPRRGCFDARAPGVRSGGEVSPAPSAAFGWSPGGVARSGLRIAEHPIRGNGVC